ncbi:MAG: hypothetical protein ABI759_22875 [Candidatus Solibacter sp.]
MQPTARDTEPREVKLGQIQLPPGPAVVRVKAINIEGGELFRLLSVTLRPLQ